MEFFFWFVMRKAVKKKVEKKKIVKVSRNDYDEELFESLRSVRGSIAEELDKPLFVVFSNDVLKELSYYYPMNKDLFLAIKGIGESKYEKYGEQFIGLIKDYVESSGVSDSVLKSREDELRATIVPEKPKINVKERTALRKARVKELIGEKKSIEEMAQDLELTSQTIVNYIDKLIKDGERLDVEHIKASIEGYNDIKKSFDKHGLEKLGPVYGDFAGMVEYSDIALVRVLMGA